MTERTGQQLQPALIEENDIGYMGVYYNGKLYVDRNGYRAHVAKKIREHAEREDANGNDATAEDMRAVSHFMGVGDDD